MKQIILLVCAAALACACSDGKNKSADDVKSLRDSLSLVISQKDAELNSIMATFNEIQDGFRDINAAEGRIEVETSNPERLSASQIQENIDFIRTTMQLNRERIADLENRLKASTFNLTELKKALARLQADLTEKNQQIAQLEEELRGKNLRIAEQDATIASQSSHISSLTDENQRQAATVASQAGTMAAQDKQINQAWYVFGTKSELKGQNILQSGDVLKAENFNKGYFTEIDIRVTKSIKLYSKNAKLLTTHPAGSYRLEQDAQKQYTLQITNPEKFWSVSKYLVILVK